MTRKGNLEFQSYRKESRKLPANTADLPPTPPSPPTPPTSHLLQFVQIEAKGSITTTTATVSTCHLPPYKHFVRSSHGLLMLRENLAHCATSLETIAKKRAPSSRLDPLSRTNSEEVQKFSTSLGPVRFSCFPFFLLTTPDPLHRSITARLDYHGERQ